MFWTFLPKPTDNNTLRSCGVQYSIINFVTFFSHFKLFLCKQYLAYFNLRPWSGVQAATNLMYTPEAPFNPQGDVLRHYNEKAHDAEYVALQNYGIDDLTPLLPQLAKLKRMRHLNLSGNNLARLPDDLSCLGAVETFDISRNAFNDAESVVAGLYSLPHLLHLKINLPEQEENKLVATLTNVQTINGVILDEDDLDPDEQQRKEEEAAAKVVPPPTSGYSLSTQGVKLSLGYKPWTGKDTERFSKLYEQVGLVSGKVSLPEEYKDFSRTVMSHMRARTTNEADILKLQVHQFNASALLLEFSFDELVRVCSRYGSDVSLAMQMVFENHIHLIRQASVTMAFMQEDRDRRLAAVQEDLQREILLRERTQRAYEANFGATIAGGRMQFSDAEMRKGPAPYGLAQLYPQQNALDMSYTGSPTSRNAATDYSDASHPNSPTRKGNRSRHGSPQNNNKSGFATFVANGTGSIPLPELLHFIKILLKSKAECDEANAMARLPPETLEQHIYTLICSKTHKEEVIKARVQAIYDSIEVNSKTEVAVDVISKVLSGNLEESYIYKHQQLEGLVYDTIRASMAAQEVEQKRLAEQAAAAGGPANAIPLLDGTLDETQVKKVIDLIVPWPVDKRMRLLKVISSQMRRKELEPDRYIIHHAKLASGILRFLLNERLQEVKNVAEQFRVIDSDKSGVIDINHFKHLLMAVFPHLTAKKAQQLAASADPFDNNVVNFNTSVRVVEAYKATEQQENNMALAKEVDAKGANLLYNARREQPPMSTSNVSNMQPLSQTGAAPNHNRISLQHPNTPFNPQGTNAPPSGAHNYASNAQHPAVSPSAAVYRNQPTQQHYIQRSSRSPAPQPFTTQQGVVSTPQQQDDSQQPRGSSNVMDSYPMPRFSPRPQTSDVSNKNHWPSAVARR